MFTARDITHFSSKDHYTNAGCVEQFNQAFKALEALKREQTVSTILPPEQL